MLNFSTYSSIRGMPFFSNIDETITKQMLDLARVQRFGKNAKIAREGDKPNFLPIVLDGLVGIFSTHNGQETTTEIKGPGSTLFLSAIVSNTVTLTSARTLAPSKVIIIPAHELRNHCQRDAGVALAVLKDMANHFHSAQRALMNMKLRSSAERLANWILQAKQDRDGCIEMQIDKRTLASCLGMSAENLSRNLRMLAKHGLRSAGQKIVVEDRSALLAFAKPNDLIDHGHANGARYAGGTFDAGQCNTNPP